MRGMRIVLRSSQEALILLCENELRRNRVRTRIDCLGDSGCIGCGLSGGGGHGVRSSDDQGASGKYSEFSCNTAEKRSSVKRHSSSPFLF
jgi:hypothetical protein